MSNMYGQAHQNKIFVHIGTWQNKADSDLFVSVASRKHKRDREGDNT